MISSKNSNIIVERSEITFRNYRIFKNLIVTALTGNNSENGSGNFNTLKFTDNATMFFSKTIFRGLPVDNSSLGFTFKFFNMGIRECISIELRT